MLYKLILKARHKAYDSGKKQAFTPQVPTIAVGNVTVGGTGKTPHTEMILSLLTRIPGCEPSNIAVVSRGYKRKSKGFQEVLADGTVRQFADEPLQIKRNFPQVRVYVDKDRINAIKTICAEESRAPKAIVLDDALQYLALKPTLSIMLQDWSHPVHKDSLLPFGRLRDLPERIFLADVLIVTKCPDLYDNQKEDFLLQAGFTSYDVQTCQAMTPAGRSMTVLFTRIEYDHCQGVFENSDPHYEYSPKLVFVSGIANPLPLKLHLMESHSIVKTLQLPDHHAFRKKDIRALKRAIRQYPTAGIATTQKDAQRFADCRYVTPQIATRMFYAPISVKFLSDREEQVFKGILLEQIQA